MHYRVDHFEFNSELNSIIEQQELGEWQSIGDPRASANRDPIHRSVLYSLTRFLIAYLSRFTRLELVDLPPVQQKKKSQMTFKERIKHHFVESFRWRNDKGLLVLLGWPNVLLLLSLCCITYFSIILHYEWSYDVHKIKLKHLKQLLNALSVDGDIEESVQMHASMKAYEACLTNKIEQIRTTLKWLGATFSEWPIMIECIHLIAIEITLFTYLLGPFWHNYHDVKQYPLVRHFLDPAGAIKMRAETVRLELNKFIESSRSFANSFLHPSSELECSLIDAKLATTSNFVRIRKPWAHAIETIGTSNSMKNLFDKHQLTIEQLKLVVLDGRLKRTHKDFTWTHLCAIISMSIYLILFTYCFMAIIIVHCLLDNFFSTNILFAMHSYKDLANQLATVSLFIMMLQSADFFQIIHVLNVIDQFRAVRKLKILIHTSIDQNDVYSGQLLSKLNGHQATRIKRTSGPDMVSLIQAIDLNLLTVIVHYRLFYGQFMRMKSTFEAFVKLSTLAVFSVPIIVRLLAAYMEPRAKPFAFLIAFAAILPIVMNAVPLCALHSRCLETYKALSSLLAQLMEFGTHPQLAEQLNFRHIESSLRKELAFSEDFRDKFAVRALGISMTYNNAIGIFFWFSIIILSLLEHEVSVERTRGLFARLQKDPLGIVNLKTSDCS